MSGTNGVCEWRLYVPEFAVERTARRCALFLRNGQFRHSTAASHPTPLFDAGYNCANRRDPNRLRQASRGDKPFVTV